MICDSLSAMIGFDCCPLTAAGNVALISTPFQFEDGEGVPVFAEVVDGQVRFFDDGGVMLHFLGRGMNLDDKRRLKFIATAAEMNGAVLNEQGEIEVWSSVESAPTAFAKYVSAILAVSAWERDQRGVSVDAALLIEDVEMALRAWRPSAPVLRDPEPFKGVSGQAYKFELLFDGQGVIATSPHPNAISANLRKLIDIKGLLANDALQFLVVIDDRNDPDAADREARVVQSVATVVPFSSLGRHVANPGAVH